MFHRKRYTRARSTAVLTLSRLRKRVLLFQGEYTVTIKELHVLTPILLLMFVGLGLFCLLQLRVPAVAALFIPEALVSVWVYYDSRALNLKYPKEWERAELASPFRLGVTALIFAPLGLPFYTYELYGLNNSLKNGV